MSEPVESEGAAKASEEEAERRNILAERREKLERLREAGIEPVPARVRRPRGHRRGAGRARGPRPGDGDASPATGSPAGSPPGAATARPRSSTSATAAARSSCTPARTCSARRHSSLLVHLDLGDFIGVEGTAFATKRGELSLRVDRWRLLAKSLRPPPDKFHGLEDTETRYRHRELDLIANEESRRAVRRPRARRSPRSGAGSTSAASSRSRRRSCSRSTAAPWRGRSPPTTTRSTATSTCGSRPSST